jgi:hypothetical protein
MDEGAGRGAARYAAESLGGRNLDAGTGGWQLVEQDLAQPYQVRGGCPR